MQKNIAGQKWTVYAFNQYTNAPVTGDAANITANLRLDGGAANPIDDTNPTELERGFYCFDLTQAETNADLIMIAPISATAQVLVIGVPGAVYPVSDFTATQKASITAAVDLSGVSTFDPASDTVARVTLVDTCTVNTDMRGTDSAATAANLAVVDGIVDAIKLKTDTLGGAGAIAWAYTLTDSVTGAPIDGAEVWVSTDSAGANIIASGTTDAYGVVNFTLDAGTIYIWRKKAGYNFSDPDTETVA